MNASVSDSPPGNKKMRQEYNGGDNEDRISSLPDSLILHIFSFMPTKYVVATSVLSKRWIDLWTSTSKLDFCDQHLHSTKTTTSNPITEKRFMNFVDRVLCLHHSPILTKFSISCEQVYDDTRVNPWISTALRCNVQELILDLYLKQCFPFPRRIFYCQSLTSLKIDLHHDFYLQISDSTCFPNLKHLHLDSVSFCVNNSTRHVFLSFPVLEEFYARDSSWLKISTVEISAPTLKRLTIDELDECANNEAEIIVDAESLVFLDLSGESRGKFALRNKSSELNAVIDFSNSNCLFKLLGGLCNIKCLELHERTISALSTSDAFLHLPTLSNLVYLTVTLEGNDFYIKNLLQLLHNMPNIESLVFDALDTCKYDESDLALVLIPQCVLSNLKSVQLDYFYASEPELCLVNFFLKNARSLERITVISSAEISDPKKQVDITKQLLMMPRASSVCMIHIV